MKVFVLGIDGATRKVIAQDERLENLRRLMDMGVHGQLGSVVPHSAVPSWLCMATSQDPGSLGIYGSRNRKDFTYQEPEPVDLGCVESSTVWDYLKKQGKNTIVLGTPFSCGKMAGLVDMADDAWSGNPQGSEAEILAESRRQWQRVRELLSQKAWDYFQFVDSGLEVLQRRFPEAPIELPHRAVLDYWLQLDQQIGSVVELLDNQTILMVISPHAAARAESGFSVNEWLIQAGYLFTTGPLETANIDWSRTIAWSDGAQIFFNVIGREPNGTVAAADYPALQAELKAKLELAEDGFGRSLKCTGFRPDEIYRNLRGVPPDLIACLCVGAGQEGMFLMAAPDCPLIGEYEGAKLLDMAPTLLDLAGYEIPDSMQGRSLVAGLDRSPSRDRTPNSEEEKALHDRLAGLGYI